MNKRSFVEVTVSSRLRKNSFITFLCLLLFPTFIFSQVKRDADRIFLNGFGRYIFIDNQLNLLSLFSSDVDGDGNVDIGGLDETGKNLFIYYGKGSNQFTQPIRYFLGGQFSGLLVKNLKLDNRVNLIAFSKVEGQIKVFSFNRRSISTILNLKVDCCFYDLIVVNLDRTSQLEIVLYGPNFNGLGIISLRNNDYTYKRLEIENFTRLIPFHLNSDDRIDLVGFNSLSKELVLLRNNAIYNYSKNTYQRFDENIDEILSGNFDDDLINDLVLISNYSKSMYVLYGNGIGGFSRRDNITLNSKHSNNIVFDYNRDLIDDLITYNRFDKKISLVSISENYQRIISQPLIEVEKLFSITGYRTTTTKGVAFSTSQGIFLIVYSSLGFEQQRYSISSNPVDILTYRLSNELFPRIIFIDKALKKLNILVRNEFNSPQEIISIPLSFAYESVKILRTNREQLYLICFKPLNYHFDLLEINFETGKYSRENLSVDGMILDIGYESSPTDKMLLNVLVQSRNELKTIILKPYEVNKIVLNEPISEFNFLDYSFDFSNRELYFINKDIIGNEMHLWSKKFESSFKQFELKKLISFKNKDYLSAKLMVCDFFGETKFALLNLSGLKENVLLLVPLKNPDKYFTLDNILIKDFNSCKCLKHTIPSNITFSFYNEVSKAFEKITFNSRGKPINSPVKNYPMSTLYSIDHTLKHKAEIVYISNYSIINIESLRE